MGSAIAVIGLSWVLLPCVPPLLLFAGFLGALGVQVSPYCWVGWGHRHQHHRRVTWVAGAAVAPGASSPKQQCSFWILRLQALLLKLGLSASWMQPPSGRGSVRGITTRGWGGSLIVSITMVPGASDLGDHCHC